MYKIKEIYYTLQGEGFHTGKHAVFCRFSGCNLWTGLEKDREKAICNFCDTDFVGTDGIMLKLATVDAIKIYDELEGKGTMLYPLSYRSIVESNLKTIRIIFTILMMI